MAESRSSAEIPPYYQLMWPTLQALKMLGNSATIQEIEEKVIEIAGYSTVQQSVLHNQGPHTEIYYRLTWARNYLKNVDAIERSSRGVWTLTESGRTLTEADMAAIPARVRAKFSRKGKTSKAGSATGGGGEEPNVDPDVVDAWQDRLLEVLQAMPPPSFERLCKRLLRESGFTKVEVTGRSGDGGIDGIGVLRLALLSFQVFFQCKRYRGSVGAAAVRDFRGAMVGRTDKGLIITTGTFTTDAQREATRDGAPPLDLIDGEQLCDLLKEKGLGVTTRMVEQIEIEPDWFAAI